MTVSVVIPCYRQARYLAECIGSLQSQTYPDWEAIIVNDGSPDDAAQVAQGLAALDKRVSVINRPNGGVSSARNAGLAVATGEFVQFLDADDLLEPAKLERQVRYLNDNPSVGLVYGMVVYFRDSDHSRRPFANAFLHGGESRDWMAERASEPGSVLSRLFRHNILPVCAPLVRRRAAGSVLHFDAGMDALEDWEFWTRLAANDVRFEFLPTLGAACMVRVHEESATHDERKMVSARSGLRLRQLTLANSVTDRVFLLAELMNCFKVETGGQFRRKIKEQLWQHLRGTEYLSILLAQLAFSSPSTYARLTLDGRILPWRVRAITSAAKS